MNSLNEKLKQIDEDIEDLSKAHSKVLNTQVCYYCGTQYPEKDLMFEDDECRYVCEECYIEQNHDLNFIIKNKQKKLILEVIELVKRRIELLDNIEFINVDGNTAKTLIKKHLLRDLLGDVK